MWRIAQKGNREKLPITFISSLPTISSAAKQLYSAGQCSIKEIFSSSEWIGISGEGVAVVLDLYGNFCSYGENLTELMRYFRGNNGLLDILENLRITLKAAVMAALIALTKGVRDDKSEIAESGTVSILTRYFLRHKVFVNVASNESLSAHQKLVFHQLCIKKNKQKKATLRDQFADWALLRRHTRVLLGTIRRQIAHSCWILSKTHLVIFSMQVTACWKGSCSKIPSMVQN